MAGTSLPLLIIGAMLVTRGLRIDHTARSGLPGEGRVVSATQASFGVGSGNDSDYRVTPIFKLVLAVTCRGTRRTRPR